MVLDLLFLTFVCGVKGVKVLSVEKNLSVLQFGEFGGKLDLLQKIGI
jgi:hypothetical protein